MFRRHPPQPIDIEGVCRQEIARVVEHLTVTLEAEGLTAAETIESIATELIVEGLVLVRRLGSGPRTRMTERLEGMQG